jgi:lysophospholipase L1-like esterase
VSTGPVAQDEKQTLIAFNGLPSSWIKFYLTGVYPAYFPASMFVGTTSSTIYPPINRSVFVASSDPGKTTLRWNYVTQTNAAQGQAFSSGGGTIGAVNSGEYFSGIIYRVLVYSNAHTAAQMNAQVSELSVAYGVPTNFTKQAVCRGASSVEGVGSTMLQSWPFQLWQRYPEIAWHNQGIGGEKIGPSSNVDTMINQDFNFVDPLYDPKLERNWLLFYAGINDINSDGISGLACYGRLTNYVAARKAAHPWTVIVGTITPSIQDQVRKGEFNFCIRTNVGNYEGYVDPGYLSPVETRLNDYTDLTYYTSDGLHLNNTGYSVIADHFGSVVNVPHRTTGNFGP